MPTATFPLTDVLLVREVTSSELGLHYEREVLSEKQIGEREECLSQTLRVYDHKAEALAAKAVVERARARIRKLCAKTVLGLVCPTSKEAELEAAVAEVEAMIAEANREFSICKVDYTVVPIRVEHDNARAMDALRREIQGYGERLVAATKSLDPVAIRRVLRSGEAIEALIAEESLRQSFVELGREAQKTVREIKRAAREYDGDEARAKSSPAVRASAEQAVRRFQWAEAFGVPATSAAVAGSPADADEGTAALALGGCCLDPTSSNDGERAAV